jgi:predicted transcriptional regulator
MFFMKVKRLDQRIEQFLTRKKVATVEEICSEVGRADITVKQALARLDYLTSYNQNSRFYTLQSTARFNRYGIWRHKKASFTRHGTLVNLLVALVDDSRSGYNSAELEEITGVMAREVLARLTKKGRLARIRRGREYFYFTIGSKRTRARQIRRRFGRTAQVEYKPEDMAMEELKKTIAVLLEIIRSQPRSQRELRHRLHRTHPEISGATVRGVCDQYGIRLKKNRIPTGSSTSSVN